ncbi:MAG TPA: ABC transporter substrate-binding protein [Candidatus Acidoferrum sp.]|nr:ABC transporter substrate-binding protein [Candidatus Acidoferrum sp.]
MSIRFPSFARTRHLASVGRRLLLAFALLLPLAVAGLATAADADGPGAAVKVTVENILAILRKPGFKFETDRPAISAEVRKAFDDVAMAQSVLSTNWKMLNPDQQTEFKGLMLQTIESTYIGRIKAYTNETVQYRKEEVKGSLATVDTAIVTSSKEIPVNYKLRKRSDGWFVYDVEVENVSMVSTYRDSYRDIFAKEGIAGLLKQMKAKIAELETK